MPLIPFPTEHDQVCTEDQFIEAIENFCASKTPDIQVFDHLNYIRSYFSLPIRAHKVELMYAPVGTIGRKSKRVIFLQSGY